MQLPNSIRSAFDVLFLEEAVMFLERIDHKARYKVIYNIEKASYTRDPVLFKKLNEDIWEFRTLYQKTHYRFFAFWDKSTPGMARVIVTHGLMKKSGKTPRQELDKAQRLKMRYHKQTEKA